MTNIAVFTTNIEEPLELESREGESEAAVSRNPSFSWAKFVLTDDRPNENKQRVTRDEFANLIKTGIHAPIKMEAGDPHGNHANSTPIGVITALKDSEHFVEGIAALWTRERGDDIASLKKMYQEGKPPQLSWEIMYEESKLNDDGIEDLIGTALRAVTIVGMPAYAGRTPIVAMASKNQDPNSEDNTVEELEQLKADLEHLKVELEGVRTTLAEKEDAMKIAEEELTALREFKAGVDKEKDEAEKLAAIKNKFIEAGLEKPEEFYSEKKEMLLGLSETALDFMIQEMVAFAQSQKESKSSKKTEVPPFLGEETIADNPKELAKLLRERLQKKQ